VFDAVPLWRGSPAFATAAYWNIAAGIVGGLLAAVFGAIAPTTNLFLLGPARHPWARIGHSGLQSLKRTDMTHLSRREFAALAVSAAAAPFALSQKASGAAITAQDVIDRIKMHIGVEWTTDSVDGIKIGEPSTVATGVVTTSMATLSVLQQAVKAGANVVITGQPTFYARTDAHNRPDDPIFAAKNAFIARHNIVVFRLSEHWRLRQPDPFAHGMAVALAWTKYQSAADPRHFDLPAMTIESLSAGIKKRLQSRGGVRVVGDQRKTVRRVGLLAGTTPIQASLNMLPNVDVILAGEVREWESVEYARDKVFSGEKKGLILVGRVVSEEPGMSICARWLKTFVPEVLVRHVSAGDPYWRPA
jgi:putative NIF3 family GTP cyclohydrolase 1 type 2